MAGDNEESPANDSSELSRANQHQSRPPFFAFPGTGYPRVKTCLPTPTNLPPCISIFSFALLWQRVIAVTILFFTAVLEQTVAQKPWSRHFWFNVSQNMGALSLGYCYHNMCNPLLWLCGCSYTFKVIFDLILCINAKIGSLKNAVPIIAVISCRCRKSTA